MLEKIYNKVSKTENAEIVFTKNITGNSQIKKFDQVIAIETEVSLDYNLKILLLYIALEEPYSINLPKIFIDEKSYDKLKYVPHINSDHSICVIDEGENFTYIEEDLPTITLNLLKRVKEILRLKNNDLELRKEFEREFSAYWEIDYAGEKNIKEVGLCLIDFENFNNLKAIRFHSKIGVYKYLIYNIEKEFTFFKNYLEYQGINYKKLDVFLADLTSTIPPFKLSFYESINFISNLSDFKKKINKLLPNNFIIVFKNNYNELFGWEYPHLSVPVPGFRENSNWRFLKSPSAKTKYVNRLSFANISPKRLDVRTSGIEVTRDLKIALIGLGSVGSNLLHLLMKYPIEKYCLIDPDILKIENVFRHKHGFNYLSRYKTKVSKFDILTKNPFTEVLTIEKEINEVLIETPELLEEYDFRFIIIGISRVEKYIINHLKTIDSNKPIILIWVEPYLASGQMIFLLPEDFNKGEELISEYPYHIIDNEEVFNIKEGSCQTGYMPYSDFHLSLFLSSINLIINRIIDNSGSEKSKVISWIGDLEFIKSLNIKLRQDYNSFEKYKIYEYDI